jgi:hypothetical protein
MTLGFVGSLGFSATFYSYFFLSKYENSLLAGYYGGSKKIYFFSSCFGF